MAQRDLTVRLRADLGQYRAAMADASKSTDSLARAGQGLQNMGRSISSVGDNLTKKVTLPLALAGGAALKMAGDFDGAFTQMQTLAGVSAGEVDGLKESVMDLAGETGKAPQELAEALYFLRSSGLDASGAMEALEVSAKASAAGLGDTVVLADAVSSAMMAYSEAGLTAAEATDVLVATARAGKAEPSELAGELGRLIPLSAELGISFADVGGAVAALSTKGNDAAGASTQLLGVMSKLLRPSQQAAEMLDEVGLSTDSIRQMIAEKGLLGTLEELQARLGENGFIRYLEDVQAVQGGLGLLGGDLEATRGIFADVNDSVGATDSAFATWAESMGADNARAFAQFQVALIRVGESLAPIASDVANFASMVFEAFSNLPDGAQTAILAIAGVAAAVGPLMSTGGRLITLAGTVAKVFNAWLLPSGAVAGSFNRVGTSASGAASGVGTFGRVMQGLTLAGTIAGLATLAHSLSETKIDAEGFADSLTSSDESFRRQGEEAIRGAIAMDEFDAAVEKVAETNLAAAERMVETAEAMGLEGEALEEVRGILERKREADVQSAEDQQANTAAVEEATGAYGEEAGALEEATSALQAYSDALKAQVDPLFAAMDAITGNRDAQLGYQDSLRGVEEAQAALDEAIANHGPQSDEAAAATRGLEDAQRAVTDAQWGTVESAANVDIAMAGLKDAFDNGSLSSSALSETLAIWVRQGFLTQEQADAAARSIFGLAGAAEEADRQRVEVPASAPNAPRTRAELHGVRDAAQSIPRERITYAGTAGTHAARNELAGVRDAVWSLPSSRVIDITVRRHLEDLTFGWLSGGRERGGPVRAGEAYIVGEKRPELFIPGEDGYILPEVPPRGSMVPAGPMFGAGGGYSQNTQVSINVYGSDPQAVVDALKRYERTNGPIPVAVR